MRIIRFSILVGSLLLTAFAFSALAQLHPRELTEPQALNFVAPKPATFSLPNGIKVYYFENRELPLISLSATFRGGSLHDPAEKAGLSSLAGTVWRTGGTQQRTGDQLDEELEFLAASVETNVGTEYARVNAGCLKKDFTQVLSIFADVVMNPAFRQEKLDLAKNQAKESIRRRWDMPSNGSNLLFTEKLMGGTPYGYRSSYKTLANISREDLSAYHQRFIAPDAMHLGIVGDLSREEAQSQLEKAFQGWTKKAEPIPAIPALTEKADGTIFYAYKDTPQANMVMGHLGARRHIPEESALEVMNEIFGSGGFTARLMKEIRSNRGLTYGIYGGVSTGTDRGLFRVSSPLKAARFIEAIQAVKGIISDMQNMPVSDEELDIAKKSLINSFVFRFESKENLAGQYINLKLQGYPDNYFEKYIGEIRKVTKKDIQEAAKKFMNPSQMIIMVVGDEKKFDQPLSNLGKVVAIDYQAAAAGDRIEK